MATTALELRPSYWASVSGGKDSFYMLNLILHNLDKYPLDGVIHFELEIDYPFIKNVIDLMEEECTKYGIKFVRIKPRKTWLELYEKIGYPTVLKGGRWCNSSYKLDAKRQLEDFLKSMGYYCVSYIGYCVDEEKRYQKRDNIKAREVYPLVEFGIKESEILEWAKEQPIYNNYYKTQTRCGCMYCPMMSYLSMAYLLKYYPENYDFMIEKMKESEKMKSEKYGRKVTIKGKDKYDAFYIDNIVRTKWFPILEQKEIEAGIMPNT